VLLCHVVFFQGRNKQTKIRQCYLTKMAAKKGHSTTFLKSKGVVTAFGLSSNLE
jgi:hypothetical protein